jgi:seryl-tRNA synthetase
LQKLEIEGRQLGQKRHDLLVRIPNVLLDEVPVGEGETANTVVKTTLEPVVRTGRSHEELMVANDWLDTVTAARAVGARFRYLKGGAALAHLNLVQRALRLAVSKGFIPVIPPTMSKGENFEGGGFFPEGREDSFAVGDNLFLSGTSEYLLVAQAAEQTFTSEQLPLRFVGFSTCYRKEAGSYGKDVQGIIRQHQFDKVEMVSVCRPEDSEAEHQLLLQLQEEFLTELRVPHQVVLIGSGDTEKKATKRYDIESWFPGQERYRETHSVSNCTDYQARGLAIKYQEKSGGAAAFAHTLNGTLYTERTLLALIENSQMPDGSVNLPESLR